MNQPLALAGFLLLAQLPQFKDYYKNVLPSPVMDPEGDPGVNNENTMPVYH